MKFQFGTSSWNNYSGIRKLPHVFTEQGVAMLASVLHTEIAIKTSVAIMRAFVTMKKYISKNILEQIILTGKTKMTYQINNTLIDTYFNIGRIIVKNEQNGNIRAEYGKELLLKLSKKLTDKYGSGFSRSNLQNMRLFYNKYEKCQTVSGKLSWSHYCELIYIEDIQERDFYEKECITSKWSVRELKRQIDSSLFQRLLLSEGNKNKRKVYELSKQGQAIPTATDILKEPYVFEFLGIKEAKPILESDLEKSLINHLSSFLMELGKGFMYVGNQKRITLDK